MRPLLLLLILLVLRGRADAAPDAHFAIVPCATLARDDDSRRLPARVHAVPGSAHCVAVWTDLAEPAERAAVADAYALPPDGLTPDATVHAQLRAPPATTRSDATPACRTNRAGAPGQPRGYAGDAFAWGIDRLDGRVLDAHYCPASAGRDVDVYVVDTGVDPHASFAQPVRQGFSAYAPGGVPDPDDPDCNGHGTHVAGLAASAVYGAAPGATVTAVQVLTCVGSGPLSGVAAGLLWIEGDRQQRGTARGCVVNLSLGSFSAFSPAVDALYARLRDEQQCVVVAAAGNDGADACRYYPAAYGAVLAVGATDANDRLVRNARWGSNHGPCVDVSAPGEDLVSARGSDRGYVRLSGTSMAAPLAAGVAALLYEEQLARGDPARGAAVFEALLARATPAVRGPRPPGTPPLLVQAVPGARAHAFAVAPDLQILYSGLLLLALVLDRVP